MTSQFDGLIKMKIPVVLFWWAVFRRRLCHTVGVSLSTIPVLILLFTLAGSAYSLAERRPVRRPTARVSLHKSPVHSDPPGLHRQLTCWSGPGWHSSCRAK